MQTIVFFLKRKGIAQTLAQRLQDIPDVSVLFQSDYAHADTVVRSTAADVVLIEATESNDEDILHCLSVGARLRGECPFCRLLLLCPESNSDNVSKAVEAKRNGLIEDFVFYDASVDYLVSKLLSM